MTAIRDLRSGPAGPMERRLSWPAALALFAIWLAIALWLLSNHAVWRDEMRALSLAVRGDTVFAMLRGLHGEGHPAVWYLLLRAAHDVVGQPVALQIAAVVISAGAILLLVLRAPLHWALVAAFVLGNVALFEYTVVARNYGISMLLMFAFAAAYPKFRDAGPAGGLLLLVLANTNVHSVVLSGALLLFWCGDLVSVHGWRWTPPLRNFLGQCRDHSGRRRALCRDGLPAGQRCGGRRWGRDRRGPCRGAGLAGHALPYTIAVRPLGWQSACRCRGDVVRDVHRGGRLVALTAGTDRGAGCAAWAHPIVQRRLPWRSAPSGALAGVRADTVLADGSAAPGGPVRDAGTRGHARAAGVGCRWTHRDDCCAVPRCR